MKAIKTRRGHLPMMALVVVSALNHQAVRDFIGIVCALIIYGGPTLKSK